MDLFGGNLDAVLGIIAYPNLLSGFAKGQLDPAAFFALFDTHTTFGLLRQQGSLADEVARIRDGRCVLAAAAAARFEHRRVFRCRGNGFDCGRITVGRNLPTERRWQRERG